MSEEELTWFAAALDHDVAPSQEDDASYASRLLHELGREDA